MALRAGLPVKKFIEEGISAADCDNIEGILIIMFNFSDEEFKIKNEEKIAQLIIETTTIPETTEVELLE